MADEYPEVTLSLLSSSSKRFQPVWTLFPHSKANDSSDTPEVSGAEVDVAGFIKLSSFLKVEMWRWSSALRAVINANSQIRGETSQVRATQRWNAKSFWNGVMAKPLCCIKVLFLAFALLDKELVNWKQQLLSCFLPRRWAPGFSKDLINLEPDRR